MTLGTKNVEKQPALPAQKKKITNESKVVKKYLFLFLFFGGRGARPGSASGCFKKKQPNPPMLDIPFRPK
jgi:hypothetical protein